MSPPRVEEVLAVSSRLKEGRAGVLADLVRRAGRQAEVVAAGPGLPDPSAYGAVVIDGPWPEAGGAWLEGLRRAVEAGGAVVVLGTAPDPSWGDLAPQAAAPPVAAEVFVKVADGAHPLGRRVWPEFPVEDVFSEQVPEPGCEVVLAVSIGFRDRPALTVRALGAGRVVTCGLAATDAAVAHPELGRVLARALRRPDLSLAGSREPTLGVGVVGYGPYGGMGYYHGRACAAVDGLELVAACDNSPERRKAAEAQFPGISAYSEISELAADDDVDVVVVATPPTLHAEVSLAMLEAGKHVACEKPLCMTVDDVDTLAAAAAAGGRCLTVNQNRRWDGDFLALRRAVEAGLLGDVFNIETFVGGFEHPCRAWHSDVSVSGGAVYDWGSHHIDWILQLFGEAPTVVQTSGHKRVWHDVTNLDQLRVRMSWPDGREAQFLQSDVAGIRPPKFYVQGTRATVAGHYRPVVFERLEPGVGYVADAAHHAEAPAELVLARYQSGYGLTETRLPPAPMAPHPFHTNLADHLLTGEPLAVTVESVRKVVGVLEAAQRSSDEGGVALSLEL